MINDCDHKCPKAVGFSDLGVVLHCSEWLKSPGVRFSCGASGVTNQLCSLKFFTQFRFN